MGGKVLADGNIEQRLVLALLAFPGAVDLAQELQETLPKISCERFLEILPPDVAPYVFHVLETGNLLKRVPAKILTVLEQARQGAIVRHLRQQNMARQIAEAWQRQGVAALALKGLALAHTLYPHPCLRPMADLDFLVPLAHRDPAVKVLADMGFQTKQRPPSRIPLLPSPAEIQMAKIIGKEVVLVEIHFAIDYCDLLPAEWKENLTGRSEIADLGGVRMGVLHPTDQWIALCLHLSAKHDFEVAHGLVDLCLLLQKWGDRVNWQEVAEYCASPGENMRQQLILRVLSELLHAPLPAAARAAFPESSDLSEAFAMVPQQFLGNRIAALPPQVMNGLFFEPAWQGLLSLREYARRWTWEDSAKREVTWKSAAYFPARLANILRLLAKVPAQFKFSPRTFGQVWSTYRRRARLQRFFAKAR